jgi:hypothetical protein
MMRPDWTAEDARQLRQRDGSRRDRLHALIGRPLFRPMRAGLASLASLFGERAYSPAMARAGVRMNAHQHTAFQGYMPDAQDIICSAYFKAGTNWVMHICYQISQLGEGQFDHIQDVIAWPDAAEPRYWRALADHEAAHSSTGYRVIKSHLPATLVPLESPAKFIAVTRDPLDCAASGYHFFAKLYFGAMTPPPDAWLDFFGSEDAICGPWYDFTASWWHERQRTNVLFLNFEAVKADPVAAIHQIAAFLGITLTPQQAQRIAAATSFEAMKEINAKFYPVRQTIWSTPGGTIIRKGAVGDGDALFSPNAVARFRTRMAEGLDKAGCDLPLYGFGSEIEKDNT